MRVIILLVLAGVVGGAAFAQRPRSIDTSSAKTTTTTKPAPAPQAVKAKYEGGVFGYNKTMEGTLSFDDANNRLLFRGKEQKEISIPYHAVTSAFADTQKRRPAAATVMSSIPIIYSLPAHFIKTKVRYLTLQYDDPDTHVSGMTSFKLESKEILTSVLNTLADRAELTTRGDIYVKRKPATTNP